MTQQLQKPLARHTRRSHICLDDVEAHFVILWHDDRSCDAWLLPDPVAGAATAPFAELKPSSLKTQMTCLQ